ncbi:MAG TPA: PAS domain-containing protein, partial [Desulfobacteraceae bacterium]|nr:PAS domain-containing protein [Desulfobacteraceae bacterium]
MADESKNYTEIILNSIADGVFTVDRSWKITSFNKAAERITGINKRDAIGRYCWEVFRASICEKGCALRETMESGHPIIDSPIFILNSKGDRIPISISTALLRDEKGEVVGGVETFRDLSVVEALRKELKGKQTFHDIVSKNKEIQKIFDILEKVAETDTTVLIAGESGTGKELFAKAIHSMSPRKDHPFITINCGALPDTLLESELFGYKKGAFTDAKRDKPGRVALAQGGTLFLDEIGDTSPALQVRLLRLIQERIYEPLGSIDIERADVRFIAATNKDLEALVREGRFREDLYFRINVVKIKLPPLRERKEDIPLLIEHFIERFNRITAKDIAGVTTDAMSVLMAYDYPGNIRELENIIEYAVVVCNGRFIDIKDLPEFLRGKEGLKFQKDLRDL